jgi:hypothetical protein
MLRLADAPGDFYSGSFSGVLFLPQVSAFRESAAGSASHVPVEHQRGQ